MADASDLAGQGEAADLLQQVKSARRIRPPASRPQQIRRPPCSGTAKLKRS